MKLKKIINPWTGAGFEQISTEWRFFGQAVGGNEIPLAITTNPDNIYMFESDVVIPVGETVYVEPTRVLRSIDEAGNVILDETGNEIITKYVVTTRTPITTTDGLVNANTYRTPEIIKPIITIDVTEDNFQFTSSQILPKVNTILSCHWTILSVGEVILAEVLDGVDAMNAWIVPKDILARYNDLEVHLVQRDTTGLVSPVSKLDINLPNRVKFISNINDLSVSRSNLISYRAIDGTLLVDTIKEISILDTVTLDVIKTFQENETNTFKLEVNELSDGVKYLVNFHFNDGVVETHVLTTMNHRTFIVNPDFTYEHEQELHATDTLNNSNIIYVEKQLDGRFLNTTLSADNTTDNWTWCVTEGGKVIEVEAITGQCPWVGGFVAINTTPGHFVVIAKDSASGLISLFECFDNKFNASISISNVVTYPSTQDMANAQNIKYNPVDSKLYLTDGVNQRLLTYDLVTKQFVELLARPDNVVSNTVMINLGGSDILTFGNTNNSYLYDPVNKVYRFLTRVPDSLLNTPIQVMPMNNGNIAISPLNDDINLLVVFDIKQNKFIEYTLDVVVNGYKWIKSNGAIIRFDAIGAIAYLV